MSFLFCFNVKARKGCVKCVPIKLTIIFIVLVCLIFALMNFLGFLHYKGDHQNDFYFYFIQVCGIVSPLLILYTLFVENETILYIAIYFHSLYVVFMNTMYIVLVTLLLIINIKFVEESIVAFTIQFVYNIFIIYANYVFYCFEAFYEDNFSSTSNDNRISAYSNI